MIPKCQQPVDSITPLVRALLQGPNYVLFATDLNSMIIHLPVPFLFWRGHNKQNYSQFSPFSQLI